MIALIHAAIISLFWRYRDVVLRRTAIMVSMVASSILTVVLAILVASGGMRSSPLYGLAFMHLVLAFCHPGIHALNKDSV